MVLIFYLPGKYQNCFKKPENVGYFELIVPMSVKVFTSTLDHCSFLCIVNKSMTFHLVIGELFWWRCAGIFKYILIHVGLYVRIWSVEQL